MSKLDFRSVKADFRMTTLHAARFGDCICDRSRTCQIECSVDLVLCHVSARCFVFGLQDNVFAIWDLCSTVLRHGLSHCHGCSRGRQIGDEFLDTVTGIFYIGRQPPLFGRQPIPKRGSP